MSTIIGWKHSSIAAPTADYQKLELGFKAKHLKVKTATNVTLSFDGSNDHLKLVAADGVQSYPDVNKSVLWYKGAGALEITAWDGN